MLRLMTKWPQNVAVMPRKTQKKGGVAGTRPQDRTEHAPHCFTRQLCTLRRLYAMVMVAVAATVIPQQL